jgi:hypothetical protein
MKYVFIDFSSASHRKQSFTFNNLFSSFFIVFFLAPALKECDLKWQPTPP